MVNVET